jgi:HEAT repeat protein
MSNNHNNIPLPSNPSELESVLSMLLQPDNEKIKQASLIMKNFLKSSASVTPLMHTLTNSSSYEARQMSAVLLRQKIKLHYKKLSSSTQNEIKQTLLKLLINEPQRNVRLSVAALISSLAVIAVRKESWNELLEFLLQCSKSNEANHREVSMMLFHELCENLSVQLKKHFKTLKSIFIEGLRDSDERVRAAALKAIGALIELIDPEDKKDVLLFTDIIPPLCDTVQYYISKRDDSNTAAAFELFDLLAQTSVPVLDTHLPRIIQLMLNATTDQQFDMKTREKGAMFIAAVVEAKPMKLVKAKLIDEILRCSMALTIEKYEELLEHTEMSPQKMGVEILDSIFLNVPKQLFYQNTLGTIANFMKSSNKFERKGGLVILAVMAEGCAELLIDGIKELSAAICSLSTDSDSLVRTAAWVAMTQFADHLQPEISQLHKNIFPFIFKALNNANESESVKEKACIALDVFCENLEASDIKPFIGEVMTQLVNILTKSKLAVQEASISAMKSIAAAADDSFTPFLSETMKIMLALMNNKNDEFLRLRCRATECIGYIAKAVKPLQFQPYLKQVLTLVMEGMELNYFELREASYTFFGKLAESLGDDYSPFIQPTMSFILATCHSDDGVVVNERENAFGSSAVEFSDEEEANGSDGDDYDNIKGVAISIRSGALDEKVSALHCMASIISSCSKHFLAYTPRCLAALDELSEYPHKFVRHAVMHASNELLNCYHNTFPNPRKANRGEIIPMHNNTKQVVDALMPLFVERIEGEDDRETVAAACDAITDALKLFSWSVLADKNENKLYKLIQLLLEEKAACQRPTDEEDEQTLADHDEILIDSVFDLISALAAVGGARFLPAFHAFFPFILKFGEAHKPIYDRSMAIGCIAEVCGEFNSSQLQPYINQLLPLIMNCLKDEAIEVRRNAAFAVGNLALNGGAAVQNLFNQFLPLLQPLFNRPDSTTKQSTKGENSQRKVSDADYYACRDNAVAAICKMIKTAPQLLPIDKLLPAIISALPIKGDYQEAGSIYPCLISLYKSHTNLIGPFTPQIIAIFIETFGDPEVDTEVQREMIAFIKALSIQNSAAVQQVVQQLSPELQKRFIDFINSN